MNQECLFGARVTMTSYLIGLKNSKVLKEVCREWSSFCSSNSLSVIPIPIFTKIRIFYSLCCKKYRETVSVLNSAYIGLSTNDCLLGKRKWLNWRCYISKH